MRSKAVASVFDLQTPWVRRVAGLGLILHGVAHAVFPLRGAGRAANSSSAEVLITLAWGVAMVGFVATGWGLLGAYPFSRLWRRSLPLSVGASAIAFAVLRQRDLLPGAAIDAIALVAFYRTTRVGRVTPSFAATGRRWVNAARNAVAVAMVAYLAFCAATRSQHQRWGTTDDELQAALPGDWPDRDPAFEVNHAISINAPAFAVWPWLAQLGQDRGGFYSYDWLENLFGLNIHNASRIHPDWQEIEEGDLVRAAPADWLGGAFGDLGWRVSNVEPGRHLVLDGWGAFVLVPATSDTTRLLVRSKTSDPKVPVWGAALSFATFELPHFIMQKRMLIGIQQRAAHKAPDPPVPNPEQKVATP
jgi:hypothetical protein